MRKFKYTVYHLDMWPDDNGTWFMNNRVPIGSLDIEAESEDDITPKMVLEAMTRFEFRDFIGRKVPALSNMDGRKVYAKPVTDFGDDFDIWEVGAKKKMKPYFELVRERHDE